MSDQTPSLNNLGNVDGSNLINVPGGGGGITSINGDATPAQTLSGTGVAVVTDLGGGAHNINVPAPLSAFLTSINGDTTPAQTLSVGAGLTIVDGGGGMHTISVSFPAALTSINGDATAAQTLTGSGCSIIDTGGGGHTISIDFPDFILGVGINLDLQAAATYNLYTVPGGFAGAVVTKVVMVLVAGDPSISGDGSFTMTSPATSGTNDYVPNTGTSFFSPTNNLKTASFVLPDNTGPRPLYVSGDTFQLVSGGGTDPATFMVYVFGFLVS